MPAGAQIDNWSDSDNKVCVELVHQILSMCNLFGYGEIRDGAYTSSLMGALGDVKDPRFVIVTINCIPCSAMGAHLTGRAAS